MKLPKVTKCDLTFKVDAFYWSIATLVGGTPEEIRKQAPQGVKDLQAKADYIAEMATRQGKIALADSHLQERIANIPARIATYREYNLPFKTDCKILTEGFKQPTASNVLVFSPWPLKPLFTENEVLRGVETLRIFRPNWSDTQRIAFLKAETYLTPVKH